MLHVSFKSWNFFIAISLFLSFPVSWSLNRDSIVLRSSWFFGLQASFSSMSEDTLDTCVSIFAQCLRWSSKLLLLGLSRGKSSMLMSSISSSFQKHHLFPDIGSFNSAISAFQSMFVWSSLQLVSSMRKRDCFVAASSAGSSSSRTIASSLERDAFFFFSFERQFSTVLALLSTSLILLAPLTPFDFEVCASFAHLSLASHDALFTGRSQHSSALLMRAWNFDFLFLSTQDFQNDLPIHDLQQVWITQSHQFLILPWVFSTCHPCWCSRNPGILQSADSSTARFDGCYP